MKPVLLFYLIIAVLALMCMGCDPGSTCADRYPSKIKVVGGCSAAGYCGVVLEDGSELLVRFPIAGSRVSGFYCPLIRDL